MSLKTKGYLYVNNYRKEERHPEYAGYVTITGDQVAELVRRGKAGEEVKLQLACWVYPSKKDPEQDTFFLVADAEDRRKKDAPSDVPF